MEKLTINVDIAYPETKLLIGYYIQAEKQYALSRNYVKAQEAKEKADYLAAQSVEVFKIKHDETLPR